MIRVSVFYPNHDGAKFDIAYYCDKHMPMVRRLLGPALKGMTIDHGIAGATPGAPAAYAAMGHLTFDSLEAFQNSFGANAQAIMGDIPNYTNVQPMVQISEVKL